MKRRGDLDILIDELEGRQPLRETLVLFAIAAAIGAILTWAFVTEVDDVTRAQGRVVPSGDIQRIQSPDEGVIRIVHVAEGDIVDPDDILVEFDALVQNSQLDREVQRALALQAKIERLNAEIGETPLVFSNELESAPEELLRSERALHQGRLRELQGELRVLERKLEQRRRERDEVLSDFNAAQEISALLAEQRAIIAPLVASGIESRLSMIEIERQEREQANRIARAEASLLRLDLAEAEIQETIETTRNRFRREALSELSEATAELASLRPSLPALENLADRATLRSPVRGVVNRLYRRTVGGAVRLGEDIAEIVPLDDELLVEAYIHPRDIAFIGVDQPVRIKLSAYDFTRYGALDGTIMRIGANAIELDQQQDSGEVFVAILRTSGALYDAEGEKVQIIPGMTAEVDILAGKRRVIDYLIQPINRTRARAFQD